MRNALVATLAELAGSDDRIVLITGDLGWSVVEAFAQQHPERFVNVGVAEANMMGIATGLAMDGFMPFVYSIASFSSMRCYEQARNGPVLHELPVRIVGIGGGYAYGHAGPTHHALEDVAIARVQPGLAAVAPADPVQTRTVVRACLDRKGPVYLRIGKGANPVIPGLEGRFSWDTPEIVRSGSDLLLISYGSIVAEVLAAAELAAQEGISATVAVLAHVGLSPGPRLVELLAAARAVVTVEEAYLSGGLGSLVAETIASQRLSCRLERLGVGEPAGTASGGEAYLRRRAGLDASSLATVVCDLVAGRR